MLSLRCGRPGAPCQKGAKRDQHGGWQLPQGVVDGVKKPAQDYFCSRPGCVTLQHFFAGHSFLMQGAGAVKPAENLVNGMHDESLHHEMPLWGALDKANENININI